MCFITGAVSFLWKTDDTKDTGSEILWHNFNIKVGHRLVFYKELYEKNIIYVNDLLNKNNKFMCYNEFKRIQN